jgi:hypothetical protein
MRKGLHALAMLCTLASVSLVGCGKTTPEKDTGANVPVPNSLPDWVQKGSVAFEGDRGKAIYGVGAVSGVRNYALLRRAADNQGRVEVAKILSTNVSSLAKSYARSVGNMDSSQEEQLIQDVSKSYTSARLSGVEIVDHHYDIPTKTMFSLALLDLDTFKKLTEAAKELPKAVREHILKNANTAFDELDAQKKE